MPLSSTASTPHKNCPGTHAADSAAATREGHRERGQQPPLGFRHLGGTTRYAPGAPHEGPHKTQHPRTKGGTRLGSGTDRPATGRNVTREAATTRGERGLPAASKGPTIPRQSRKAESGLAKPSLVTVAPSPHTQRLWAGWRREAPREQNEKSGPVHQERPVPRLPRGSRPRRARRHHIDQAPAKGEAGEGQ